MLNIVSSFSVQNELTYSRCSNVVRSFEECLTKVFFASWFYDLLFQNEYHIRHPQGSSPAKIQEVVAYTNYSVQMTIVAILYYIYRVSFDTMFSSMLLLRVVLIIPGRYLRQWWIYCNLFVYRIILCIPIGIIFSRGCLQGWSATIIIPGNTWCNCPCYGYL